LRYKLDELKNAKKAVETSEVNEVEVEGDGN
jgi:hypothetical protein